MKPLALCFLALSLVALPDDVPFSWIPSPTIGASNLVYLSNVPLSESNRNSATVIRVGTATNAVLDLYSGTWYVTVAAELNGLRSPLANVVTNPIPLPVMDLKYQLVFPTNKAFIIQTNLSTGMIRITVNP